MNFDDVQKVIKEKNLYFSDADLDLARRNPNAGMTIANYKIDYNNATTADQKALANAGAEQTRKDYGNYTGGSDGSKYYLYEPTPLSYAAGSFQNPYQEEYDNALNTVLNRQKFSYDPNTDPLFQSYRQMNLREADRAQQNTMGQAASMTGGIASTAAVNAASQAGDYYRSQINDALPQYENAAYQKYNDDIGLDFDTFSMLNTLRNQERSEYDVDKNFNYNQWTDELSYRTDKENMQYEKDLYDKEQKLEQERYDQEQKLEQERYDKEQERYKTEYGDAMTMDMYNMLMADYDATGNRDSLKRARAILAALEKRVNS